MALKFSISVFFLGQNEKLLKNIRCLNMKFILTQDPKKCMYQTFRSPMGVGDQMKQLNGSTKVLK